MIELAPVILQTVEGLADPLPHRMMLFAERLMKYVILWSLGTRSIKAARKCYEQSKRYGGDYED